MFLLLLTIMCSAIALPSNAGWLAGGNLPKGATRPKKGHARRAVDWGNPINKVF
jgi:hypothetical protein